MWVLHKIRRKLDLRLKVGLPHTREDFCLHPFIENLCSIMAKSLSCGLGQSNHYLNFPLSKKTGYQHFSFILSARTK